MAIQLAPRRWWRAPAFVLLALSAAAACTGAPAADRPSAPPTPAVTDTATVQPTPRPAVADPTPTVISMPTSLTPLSPEERARLTVELFAAAEAGDVAGVRAALQQGADRDGRDARGRTPLMAATHGNQVDVVRVLLDAGADVDLQDDRLDNPFLYAGAEGLLDIVRLTIAAGADTRITNRFGGTALIPAAERGHVEIVVELLTRTDVDVDHVNNLGWTALLEAIVLSDGGERHQQVVQLLVDHGADVSIPDKEGVTPLEHARRRGFSVIEGILLAAQARDQQVIAAAGSGDLEAVRALLGQGASVSARDAGGRTALIAAAYQNNLPIARILIDAGADVNAQDDTKQSAYLIATSDGFVTLLRLTLAAGADVHSTDSYNGTGLIRAADRGHVEVIAELLKTDIDVDHVNRLGWTALLEAIILGDGGPRHTEVVRLLVDAGADVSLGDGNGVTPLGHAVQRGYAEIAEILEAAGARP